MRVLPHFVHKTLDNALNSHIYTENSLTSFVALVHNQEKRSQKLLPTHAVRRKIFLRNFAMDREIAGYYTSTLSYV